MTSTIEHLRERLSAILTPVFARHPVLRGLLTALLTVLGLETISAVFHPFVFYNLDVAVCWPTDGLVLAVLLLCKRRRWPWIIAGYLLHLLHFGITDHFTPLQIAMDCLSNLFEVLLPAFFLPHFTSLGEWLRKPKLILRFCVFALVLAPGLSAASAQIFSSHYLGKPYWTIFTQWSASDSLGIALFTPLLLVLVSRETWELFRSGKRLQNGLLISMTLLCSWLVFNQHAVPIAFLVFPMLVMVVNVIGFSGAVLTVNGLTIIAAAATIHGTGPFMFVQGAYEPYRNLILQIYLIAAIVMSFAVTLVQLERRAFEQQLNLALGQMELLATHDSLTGLGNRRLFERALEAEWSRALRERRSIALLLLDADCFKSYNDLYGHPAGDACLCLIAGALKPIVRREGDLAARYGGEEFIVLLPGSDLENARTIAESIRDQIAGLQLDHSGNRHSVVTVSVGCSAVVPVSHRRPEDLVKAADLALYAAKHQGRNRVEAYALEREAIA
jgi:diguanylate cyclase (GGDEF)-like protein